MENLAYDYTPEMLDDELDYEIIGGKKFIMAAAAPNITHGTIVTRISTAFTNYIDNNNIHAIVMGDADVYLSDEEHYRPDLSIVCNLDIVKNGKKVYGAPDLVVEVLSESTMDNDLGPKKAAYEKFGVKEYWIVDQWSKRVEVYHSIEGKFVFSKSYKVSDEENTVNDIKVSIFDDMLVDVREIFKWYFN